MVTTCYSIPKEPKALISFLNKFGTETKRQSFSRKDILKELAILRKGVSFGIILPKIDQFLNACQNHSFKDNKIKLCYMIASVSVIPEK